MTLLALRVNRYFFCAFETFQKTKVAGGQTQKTDRHNRVRRLINITKGNSSVLENNKPVAIFWPNAAARLDLLSFLSSRQLESSVHDSVERIFPEIAERKCKSPSTVKIVNVLLLFGLRITKNENRWLNDDGSAISIISSSSTLSGLFDVGLTCPLQDVSVYAIAYK
ncbi:hypothetical protein F2P81_014227 [Scophthalmus maximus]|uniref:Uncharacterized protein n=1 Tax=Scophthalmus maximus TaxID=52904 RepID=A0A6A4ST06_SCOMX|nr:hypothetical protein F2P81_014227 [Scophthalmus maximus]